MADKSNKLKARLPRGLADRGPAEIAATRAMTFSSNSCSAPSAKGTLSLVRVSAILMWLGM